MARPQLVREEDGFDLPRLGVEDGTTFGYFDRIYAGTSQDGKNLVDLTDWEARDLHAMLAKDYKAKQIESVLTLPIISAEWTIQPVKGDTGEAEWLRSYWDADALSGGCRTSLDQILSMMTTAFYYKRAYFEKVLREGTGDFEGKIVYDDICWRPQTTCRMIRDPYHGRFRGFEQEPYYLGNGITIDKSPWPIQVKPSRAFVYTHGTWRDPLNGTSDMEVAFWAWKTKQKVLMLWFQFLQGVSLPRVIVKANDQGTAQSVAQEIARMKSSGVLPVGVPGGPDSIGIDTIDLSGKGADQFLAAINWLDQCATQAVLAGFLDLQAAAANGAGSYALSNDASSFFLQSLEAKGREMEEQVRHQLFAPLIYHNFGPKAKVPRLAFEPLNDIDKATAVELLKVAMASPPGGPIPTGFIGLLAEQVANYLGLEGEKVRKDFEQSFAAAAEQAALAAEQAAPGNPAAGPIAGVAGATKAAADAARAGLSPKVAFRESLKEHKTTSESQTATQKAKSAEQRALAKKALAAKNRSV